MIQSKILEIIRDNLDDAGKLDDYSSSDPLENLGLNSIAFIKICVEIEDVFEFDFDRDKIDVSEFETLDALIGYAEAKLEEKNGCS